MLVLSANAFAAMPVFIQYDGFFLENCSRETVGITKISWETGDTGSSKKYDEGALILARGGDVFIPWKYTNYSLPKFQISNTLNSKGCFRYRKYNSPRRFAYSCDSSQGYQVKVDGTKETADLTFRHVLLKDGELSCGEYGDPNNAQVMACDSKVGVQGYRVLINRIEERGPFMAEIYGVGADSMWLLATATCGYGIN